MRDCPFFCIFTVVCCAPNLFHPLHALPLPMFMHRLNAHTPSMLHTSSNAPRTLQHSRRPLRSPLHTPHSTLTPLLRVPTSALHALTPPLRSRTLYAPHSTLHTPHSPTLSVFPHQHSTLHSPHSSPTRLLHAPRTPQHSRRPLRSPLHTPHSTLHTLTLLHAPHQHSTLTPLLRVPTSALHTHTASMLHIGTPHSPPSMLSHKTINLFREKFKK